MERYKNIIDDWESFSEACKGHPVAAVRKNPVKASANFEEQLREDFDDVERADWNPDIYRLKSTTTPGKSTLHWLGEYYVQEESAAIPVEVLAPEKGDRVLDMAAAPGGKTTQIAGKLMNQGKVIANDKTEQRLKSLHANVYRTGSVCVAATSYDGRHIPEDERYDKILLDAPCTGEGDRAYRSFESADPGERGSLAKLQRQMIEKADRLLDKDGTLVYSTCTFSPEENEEVVLHTIENTGLELERIELEAPHARGLTGFEDRDYGPELEKTIRVYPHHLDSGGMYVAKLSK
ncbi:MAG: RsmB/NOP family class I SAM-dependent RNA methyltransferase [Candidatus Nanohaloarchaea archaeon]